MNIKRISFVGATEDDSQSKFAIRLVQNLSDRGVLDGIISSNDIESVRMCEHCERLMNEGWGYEGIETFCSKNCFCLHIRQLT